MTTPEDSLASFLEITNASPAQAQFYLDSSVGDLDAAVASFFENAGNASSAHDAELSASPALPPAVPTPVAAAPSGLQTLGGGGGGSATASSSAAAPRSSEQSLQRGTYSLGGGAAEPLPAGWGQGNRGSASSSRSATPSNPLRSNQGPRVTGFRDLAAQSAAPPAFGGGGGGRGGDDSDDEDDESRDPQNFYTGGAKSGLSVENPDNKKSGGGMSDMIKGILQQAREGSQRLAGAAPAEPRSNFFGGNANTLGSDETPSTYIPDPAKMDEDAPELGDEEEMETAVRHLTFWKDGFSIEDGDLMRYDEHKDLLAAIQSGRAPLALLKVKHDQPVELQIAERRSESWVRQPPPPSGPFAGSGNRLGAVDPYPSASASASTSVGAMPGGFGGGGGGAAGGVQAGFGSGASVAPTTVFEVDRSQPTTQLQIRLRSGERMVATFNHTHTIGDVRNYINSANPSSASAPYVLQTSFPPQELKDDSKTLKEAGVLGSVLVQRVL